MIQRELPAVLAMFVLTLSSLAQSPFAGPWSGTRTYDGRPDFGNPGVEMSFSSAGYPILMGQELGKVGTAFEYRTEQERRVVEVAALEVSPQRVHMILTTAAEPLPIKDRKQLGPAVLISRRDITCTLSGEQIVLTESEATVEATTLNSRATLRRGVAMPLLAGPWIGRVSDQFERVYFSPRGLPIVGGIEVARVGQRIGTTTVERLLVEARRIEMTVGGVTSRFVLDERGILRMDRGAALAAFIRPVRLAGRWEGPSVDLEGNPVARQTFDFDADATPILYGERRTETGRTIKTTPGLNGARIGTRTEILRRLNVTRGRVSYQIRREEDIVADVLYRDTDYIFIPRDDSEDEVDFVVISRGRESHRGKLKRVGAAPSPSQAEFPEAGALPEAPSIATQLCEPIKYRNPSPLAGTWAGTVTSSKGQKSEDYFEFLPNGLPLYGYRSKAGLRMTIPVTNKGQRFVYEHQDLYQYSVEVRELNANERSASYSVHREKRIKNSLHETETLARHFRLEGDTMNFEMRYNNSRKGSDVSKAKFKQLKAVGGFWEGRVGRRNDPDGLTILDGGATFYHLFDGPAELRHMVQITHVGQRIDCREWDGGQYTLIVRYLESSPLLTEFFVERVTTPADPRLAVRRDYLQRVWMRSGEELQYMYRNSNEPKFDGPFENGVLTRK